VTKNKSQHSKLKKKLAEITEEARDAIINQWLSICKKAFLEKVMIMRAAVKSLGLSVFGSGNVEHRLRFWYNYIRYKNDPRTNHFFSSMRGVGNDQSYTISKILDNCQLPSIEVCPPEFFEAPKQKEVQVQEAKSPTRRTMTMAKQKPKVESQATKLIKKNQ